MKIFTLFKGNQIIAGKHLDFGTYGAEYASIYTLLYNINSRSDNEIKKIRPVFIFSK